MRTMAMSGTITLPKEMTRVMPGNTVNIMVDLLKPVALEAGLRFVIRDGGRTIGVGVITIVLE